MSSYSLDGSLPTELICWIFRYLSCNELVVCRQLCRSLKHIVDTTVDLQYILNLQLAGMADNPAHSLGTADKLALLKRYRDQWCSLTPHLEHIVLFESIHLERVDDKKEHFIRGTLGIGPSLNFDYHFAQLPSRIREIPLKSWVLRLPGYTGSFAMDLQQDVLAILKERPPPDGNDDKCPSLHILELSTGKEHPLALYPSLSLPDVMEPGLSRLRINGPYIYVHCEEAETSVTWNWRSGSQIFYEAEVTGSAWLGPTHLLLVGFRCEYEPQYLMLVDISQPERVWEFHLPKMFSKHENAHGELIMFQVDCEPVTSRGGGSPGSLFDIAEEDSLVMLTALEDPFRMFFLASRLLEIMQSTAHEKTETVVIPWKSWGPGYTRVDHTWVRYIVYGMRAMALAKAGLQPYMLDFNRRRAKYTMQACSGSQKEEDRPTRIRAFSHTHWHAMVEEVEATDEQMDDLSLDNIESEQYTDEEMGELSLDNIESDGQEDVESEQDTDEQTDELSLDFDSDGQEDLMLVQTILPYTPPQGLEMWGFSEDAIHMKREFDDGSWGYEAYTL
ncbi:hypothetical protein BDW22DRAFT_1352068 [Trametopsis cervina]|nr:hypothetical protein BDW22DRAFT_1352068 [Trametopsis cervina]